MTSGFGDMTPRVATQVPTHPAASGGFIIDGAQTLEQDTLHIIANVCEMVSKRVMRTSMFMMV